MEDASVHPLQKLYDMFENHRMFEDPRWGKVICEEIISKQSQIEFFKIIQLTNDNLKISWNMRIYHKIVGMSCCDRDDDEHESVYLVDVWAYNNLPFWRKIINESKIKFQMKEILIEHAAIDANVDKDDLMYFSSIDSISEFKTRNNISELGDQFFHVLRRFRVLILHTINDYFQKIHYQDYRILGDDFCNYVDCLTHDGTICGIVGNQTHQDIINMKPKYQSFLIHIKNSVPFLKEKLEKYLSDKTLIRSN